MSTNYQVGKTSLLSLAGQAVLVQFILTAIPIYLLVALKIPKWFIRAIDKSEEDSCGKEGKRQINGGCCLVAWEKVMRPLELGGLGIHNLEIMGWALQMRWLRWLWIRKTKPARSWTGLKITVHTNISAMFAIQVVNSVGNGENTIFWTDRWIHGCRFRILHAMFSRVFLQD